jgi:hypothetical protein
MLASLAGPVTLKGALLSARQVRTADEAARGVAHEFWDLRIGVACCSYSLPDGTRAKALGTECLLTKLYICGPSVRPSL